MNLNNFYIPEKVTLPHHIRQLIESIGYRHEDLYENIDLGLRYVNATYDILYPHDTVHIHTHNFFEY